MLSVILQRGVVLTDNRRLPLARQFTLDELGRGVDLRDGSGVAAELYRLKHGGVRDQERYREIEATFTHLTKRTLGLRARSAPADGEATRLFATREASDRNWKALETDVVRGDYIDPRAGKTLFRVVATTWLESRDVDPATMIRYESLWRLHVKPVFGRRGVGSIRPSQIQAFIARLKRDYGQSTAAGAYLVLQGSLALAVTDGLIKTSPAKAGTVTKPRAGNVGSKVVAWTDDQAGAVIDAHPEVQRLIPVIMAGTGMRIGEVLGLDAADFDFTGHVLHVRRQLKKLGREHVWALPKNDLERDVPLSAWVEAATLAYIS